MKKRGIIAQMFCWHRWQTTKTSKRGYDIELSQKCYKCGSARTVYDYFDSQIKSLVSEGARENSRTLVYGKSQHGQQGQWRVKNILPQFRIFLLETTKRYAKALSSFAGGSDTEPVCNAEVSE